MPTKEERVALIRIMWANAHRLNSETLPPSDAQVEEVRTDFREQDRKTAEGLGLPMSENFGITIDPANLAEPDEHTIHEIRDSLVSELLTLDELETAIELIQTVEDTYFHGQLLVSLIRTLSKTNKVDLARAIAFKVFPEPNEERCFEAHLAIAEREDAELTDFENLRLLAKVPRNPTTKIHRFMCIWELLQDPADLKAARDLASAISSPIPRTRAFRRIGHLTGDAADFLQAFATAEKITGDRLLEALTETITACVVSRMRGLMTPKMFEEIVANIKRPRWRQELERHWNAVKENNPSIP